MAASRRPGKAAIRSLAQLIRSSGDRIKAANALDVPRGARRRHRPRPARLGALDEAAIEQMALGGEQVVQLPDPRGEIVEMSRAQRHQSRPHARTARRRCNHL